VIKNVIITEIHERTVRKDVTDIFQVRESIQKALVERNYSVKIFHISKKSFENLEKLKTDLIAEAPDAIFNLFEGFSDDPRKEAEFVSVLEQTGIPFTGNGFRALDISLDKDQTKQLLQQNNMPVPQGYLVKSLSDLEKVNLPFPLFVKPCYQDASLGINNESLVTDQTQLRQQVELKLQTFDQGLILEEFITGQEVNIGLIGSYPYEILGISVLQYSKRKDLPLFLTYAAKWDETAPEYHKLMPSLDIALEEKIKDQIIELSRKCGQLLDCRGYFRVDLREMNGQYYVLDVNPNPDISQESGFMKMGLAKGLAYEDVVEKILLSAVEHARIKCH